MTRKEAIKDIKDNVLPFTGGIVSQSLRMAFDCMETMDEIDKWTQDMKDGVRSDHLDYLIGYLCATSIYNGLVDKVKAAFVKNPQEKRERKQTNYQKLKEVFPGVFFIPYPVAGKGAILFTDASIDPILWGAQEYRRTVDDEEIGG